jgi:hypothetical protein
MSESKKSAVMILVMVVLIALLIFYTKQGIARAQVNVTELDTLDRMRYTAIQMTILDLESQQPTNLSNDEIAAEIYKFQQSNSSDRLTTIEIEELYRNITANVSSP